MSPVFGTMKVTTVRNTDLLFIHHHVYGILRYIIRLLAHAVNVNTNLNYLIISRVLSSVGIRVRFLHINKQI